MTTPGKFNDPLAAARARGEKRFAEMMSGKDMCTSAEMALLLGISARSIEDLRRANQLIGIVSPKNQTKYPQWQVNDDRALIDGLEEALAILGNNGATAYRVLCEVFPDGNDNTNWQCLQDERRKVVLRRLEAIARGDFV